MFDFLFKKKKELERLKAEIEAERERKRLAEEQRIAEERERRLAENRRKEAERLARIEKERQEKRISHPIMKYVDNILNIYDTGNIPLLQQALYELMNLLSEPGSGCLVVSYPEKDRLSEVYSLCLQYDWMNDNEIREVWAENGFYCIVEYLRKAETNKDFTIGSFDLFLICTYGKDSLYTKFNDVLRKARQHPYHFSIFSEDEYTGGADYLISEFLHFAALSISDLVKQQPAIMSPALMNNYLFARIDRRFDNLKDQEVKNKMFFISNIIGSILDEF